MNQLCAIIKKHDKNHTANEMLSCFWAEAKNKFVPEMKTFLSHNNNHKG